MSMSRPSFFIICFSLLLTIVLPVTGNAQSGSHQYLVQLLRAAPGQLPNLLEIVRGQRSQARHGLLVMRHSQGDHWDLMLMQPHTSGSFNSHDYSNLVHYQHDFLVTSSQNWEQLKQRNEGNGLYHIEMFHAAAGKKAELLKQRQMENAYYAATERAGNVIFTTILGSDVDYFTLGFYRDLAHFASEPALPAERFAQAAIDAGFKSRDDIGLYLRQLIIRHHDTLATAVK